MSDKVTHDEIDEIMKTMSVPREQWRCFCKYIAQNRERDEQDAARIECLKATVQNLLHEKGDEGRRRIDEAAARAKTLEEFATLTVAEFLRIRTRVGTTRLTDATDEKRWIIANFPQLEPKPSDLDRLAAALSSSNEASSRPDCICLIAKGTVGLMKWDGMAGRFDVPDRGMSVDEMVAHLEKPKLVTHSQAKAAAKRLRENGWNAKYEKLVERYFDQEEGE